MDLRTISKITTWGEVASDLNNNFTVIKDVIEFDNQKNTLALGFFTSLADLREAYPNPVLGNWAYVGTSFPADYYTWNGTSWEKSEDPGQPETVELEGYIQSEEVSDPTKILF